jgi:hypothetical protein
VSPCFLLRLRGTFHCVLMKLRQLESALQDVQAFTTPVVKWEQYPTSPHIAYAFPLSFLSSSIKKKIQKKRKFNFHSHFAQLVGHLLLINI